MFHMPLFVQMRTFGGENFWKGELGIMDANKIHFAQTFVVEDEFAYMFVNKIIIIKTKLITSYSFLSRIG